MGENKRKLKSTFNHNSEIKFASSRGPNIKFNY